VSFSVDTSQWWVVIGSMKGLLKIFDARVGALEEGSSGAMAAVLTTASDLALLLDEIGVIRGIKLGQGNHPIEESKSWLGLAWIDTVTPQSRPKVQEMLAEAAADGWSRQWEVNHVSASGNDLPVAYAAIRLGQGEKQFLAVGRDLRAVSALQQRLVEAQQALERDYWRMRYTESRYRLLFTVSTEAVLTVDAATLKVIEANPAAAALFDQPEKKLVGGPFPFEFDSASAAAIADQLISLRSHGQVEGISARLAESDQVVMVSAFLIRQDSTTVYLVRLHPIGEAGGGSVSLPMAAGVRLGEWLVDGFAIADTEGRVVFANRAFLEMAEVPTVEQARGQYLSRWLGRPGADLALLLETQREHGLVRLFGTSLRGDLGGSSEIEVSCSAMAEGPRKLLGFLIRDVSRRLALGPRGASDLTRAVEQLTALVGQVSLRNLVRDTADLVERHFIEAALETTQDNRTSAAEVLGVSRQSLYVKLRRYHLGGADVGENSVRKARKAKRHQPETRRKSGKGS
jgi:transcriptional regulator PpsR